MAHHELTVPFSAQWLWLPVALMVLALAAAIVWRRHLSKAALVASIAMAILTIIAVPLSWKTNLVAGLGWNKIISKDLERMSGFQGVVSHGQVRIWFEASELPPQWPYGDKMMWGISCGPNNGRYLILNDGVSLTHGDFIHKTLGFQLCSWTDSRATGGPVGPTRALYSITVPQWFVLLLCIPFPAVAARRYLKRLKSRRWIAAGCCGHCGFDLRAHKPGERCPECSAVIPDSHKGTFAADAAG